MIMKNRLFIAIEISNSLRQKIAKLQQDLKSKGFIAKWVKPENIHLTLVFLGAIDKKRQQEVESVLREIDFRQFILKTSGLGLFPNSRRPRILWLGLKDSKELFNLQDFLARSLKKRGLKIDSRKFLGHLTIARFKSKPAPKLLEAVREPIGQFPVKEVCLFQSKLLIEGPKYQKCFAIGLKPVKN